MKKILVVLLTVVILCTAVGVVFADPQNGGDDPFTAQTINL